MDEEDVADLVSPHHLQTDNIRYLGIKVSSKLTEWMMNFTPLFKFIPEDLNRWINLPISLSGRIATVKMSVLPKIYYVLSVIPVSPQTSLFKSIKSSLSKFCWKNKTPPKLYFLANQLKYLIKWFNPQSKSFWLQTDRALCRDILLFNLSFIRQTFHSISRVISVSLVGYITNSTASPSIQTINQNPPLNFTSWKIRRITHLCHVAQNKTFINFYNLIQVFGHDNSVSRVLLIKIGVTLKKNSGFKEEVLQTLGSERGWTEGLQ